MSCKVCGGKTLEESDTGSVCVSCGAIFEEVSYTAGVEFSETNQALGTVVGPFSKFKNTATASREQALMRGKREIARQADALRISKECASSATRILEMAINENFFKGRKKEHVIAACLYVACRLKGSSHLLIDFSEKLKTNVYLIGATYLKLCKLLKVDKQFKLPVVDPSWYIQRFASSLKVKHATFFFERFPFFLSPFFSNA